MNKIIALGLILALVLLSPQLHQDHSVLASAGLRHVAPGGNCSGATPCYASVQAAVDAANAGDEIRVAGGTYTGVSSRLGLTQMVYLSKNVTIRGGYGPAHWSASDPAARPTTLDAQGQGRAVYITGDISPTLEGLRITGGDSTGLGGYYGTDAGGGIYVITATVTLRGNAVFGNDAGNDGHGGGLFLLNCDGLLQANQIYGNKAGQSGAGLYLSAGELTLSGNTISDNDASLYGGGLYLAWSEATVQGNWLRGNSASEGGAGYLYFGSDAVFHGNILEGNSANHGGGLSLFRSDTALGNNSFKGNTGTVEGGGLWLFQSNATLEGDILSGNTSHRGGGLHVWGCSPRLSNVVICDNLGLSGTSLGSALYAVGASPQLLHATISRNLGGEGSGMYVTGDSYGLHSSAVFTNTIISGHGTGIVVDAASTATLNATLWHANVSDRKGAGTITHSNDRSGSPAFAADGYHITASSAAIDRGVNAGVTIDIDGEPRPQKAGYDLGADEAGKIPTHLPLVLKRR